MTPTPAKSRRQRGTSSHNKVFKTWSSMTAWQSGLERNLKPLMTLSEDDHITAGTRRGLQWGISWVVPLKISRLCCVPAGTQPLEFRASALANFVSSMCGRTEISPMHLVCFFFHKNGDTGQISKTESSAQKLLQEIHSFSSTKAPCFALLSRAEGIGVYKSQQILDIGCITHGETSGIIFFLISNMLTLQDLERMAHHTWQDSSEDYRARRSLLHLS